MSQPTGLPCPRCGGVLSLTPRGGVTVDTCAGCGGVWLGEGEIAPAAAAATAPAPTRAPQDVRYLRCPVCSTVMNRQNYERFSGVIVDTCPRHGTWADAGELERIRAFLSAGGLDRRGVKEAEERRLAASVERWGTDRSARSAISGGFTVEDVLVQVLSES